MDRNDKPSPKADDTHAEQSTKSEENEQTIQMDRLPVDRDRVDSSEADAPLSSDVEPTLLQSIEDGPDASSDDATLIQPSINDASEPKEIEATMRMDRSEISEDEKISTAQTRVGPQETGFVPPPQADPTLRDSAADAGRSQDTIPERSQAPEPIERTLAIDASVESPRGDESEIGTIFPKLGRYKVLKVLGQGAFGTVYLALDPHLDRKVAIKVAKTGVLSGKQDVDRFMREAKSAAQLRHPNIVPVYEYEELSHSSYIAYQFIEGRTLGDLMKEKGKLTCEEAVDYLIKLAYALDYAHSHGIIHRDIKPENILLDEQGEPHIADFGLARLDDGDTLRTREGMFMGTPSYMSPEQAGGKAHLADGRTDLWSLGVIMHEMLTRVRPFRGTVTDVLVAVQNWEPPPLRQIDETLPRDLETICHKCLTKDLEGRFATGKDLAEELERWRSGHPIESRRISLVARTWRWAKRNPDVAGLLGLVLAVVLLGALVSTWFGVQARLSEQALRQTQTQRALDQLRSLSGAVPNAVPTMIKGLLPFRSDIAPQLSHAINSESITETGRTRLLMLQAILGSKDEESINVLTERIGPQLLESEAEELIMLTELFEDYGMASDFELPLWRASQQGTNDSMQQFRALSALAALDSEVPDWDHVREDLVAEMLTMGPFDLSRWLPALRPIREQLEEPLTNQFMSGSDRFLQNRAATVLGTLFDDSLDTLVSLIPQAQPEQLTPLLEALKPEASEVIDGLEADLKAALAEPESSDRNGRVTNYAVALMALDHREPVWPLLQASANHGIRTRLIHAIAPAGVNWQVIESRLEWEEDPVARAALCLTLGEYGLGELLPGDRDRISDRLFDMLPTDPHPGVHAAVEWLLRQWKMDARVDETLEALQAAERVPERQWHVDPQGVTFAIFDGPIDFTMGSPLDSPSHISNEILHTRRIPRTVGIAAHEVTVAEFQQFLQAVDESLPADLQSNAPTPDCPIVRIRWFDAAMYCRWLSEQAGIDEEQMCYPSLERLKKARDDFNATLAMPENLLNRTGYRLPTAAEWEYACRTGTSTEWSFGNELEYLSRYGWYPENSGEQAHPVGMLKPNAWGMFDIHGNALEWCHNYFFDDYPDPIEGTGIILDGSESREGSERELRGGSYIFRPAEHARSAYREHDLPRIIGFDSGFRLARTYQSQPAE